MTPVQIAYFKHFLFDRGIQAIYISMYRKNRIKGGPGGDKEGNPESLEQFLQEQPPFRVLMHAFYFQAGSNFGYDYWKDINSKWRKYLELNEDNPQNDKVVVLKGSFAILRQNWDRPQYWKTETMEATYARMHMEPPLKDVDLEKAFHVPRSIYPEDKWVTDNEEKHKFKVGDIIEGSISGEVLTVVAIKSDGYDVNDGGFIDFDKEEYWTKIDEVAQEEEINNTKNFSGVPEAETTNPQPESLLEGFSLVETDNTHGGRKMGNNVVSVNMRNNGYRITFASKQSNSLRKIGYKYVKLLTKKDTGEIALIFNNQSGCSVVIKKNANSESRNVTINSKDIAEHIAKFYNIKFPIDYFTLDITATIQQDLNMIYKLKLSE
jgi:hypothetical protein